MMSIAKCSSCIWTGKINKIVHNLLKVHSKITFWDIDSNDWFHLFASVLLTRVTATATATTTTSTTSTTTTTITLTKNTE